MGLRFFLILLLPLAAPVPAAAQCLLCAKVIEGTVIRSSEDAAPLHVDIETQLDFSRVAVGSRGGEVDVDPVTGARQLRGDVVNLGGFAVTGVVTVRGTPGAELRVFLPASVDLESENGQSARVAGLKTDLSAAPRLGPDGRLKFHFGGRLQLDAADDGNYRGRIPVTVEYQ